MRINIEKTIKAAEKIKSDLVSCKTGADLIKLMKEQEKGVHITNVTRLREFSLCYDSLKMIFAGQDVTITATPHEEKFPSVGNIVVSGHELVVNNTELFSSAMSIASNYEIYPRNDGLIMMEISFYYMTEKIGGV